MAEQDKIDKLLERTLGEYSQELPRTGLENRVLARLQAQTDRPRNLRWWWIAVPVVTALVVAAILAWRPHTKNVDIATVTPVRVAVPAEPATIGKATPGKSMVQQPKKLVRSKTPVRRSPKTRDSEPRLATFPSRDSNDQLLKLAMQFAKAHPAEARKIVQQQKEFREMAEAFTAPLKEEK